MSLEIAILNQSALNVHKVEEFINEIATHLDFTEDTELSIVFCENNFIQDLNKEFRNKDYPTDVLSFPSEMPFILGDIVVSVEKAQQQATESLEKEIQMLLCHGFLHLLGYDHEKSDEDYKIMMDLQALLLNKVNTHITIKK